MSRGNCGGAVDEIALAGFFVLSAQRMIVGDMWGYRKSSRRTPGAAPMKTFPPPLRARLALQPWGLVTLEVWIIPAEQH